MLASRTLTRKPARNKQRGAALMVMLVIMIVGTVAFLVSALNSSSLQIERDKKTADALAQAKEALIGYAASVDLTTNARPGDLPCPDTNNDGLQETSCGNAAGSTGQNSRIGRLPWKTLGLPDLRDGSGERLWYAVSNNFKYNAHTTCSSSGQAGCLNSDTVGTITVRNSAGNIIQNGCSAYLLTNCPNPSASDAAFGTGAVSVIISPGEVLTRQGSSAAQNRNNSNSAMDYLDNFSLTGEDNANFVDGSSINGFIQGRVKIYDPVSKTYNVILNDQLLAITQDNIMQAIQKRVAGEVKQCLKEYAINPQNQGHYPWATPVTDLADYFDFSDQLFGRIPDTPFTNTCLDSGGYTSGHGANNCSNNPTVGMKNNWTGSCNINSTSGWWLNWKEMIFYGLADAYKPVDLPSTPACGTCLTVNPSSSVSDKKFVVIVAGKKLSTPNQTLRNSNKSNPFYYLENGNESADQSGGYTFTNTPSANFNDTIVFQ